MLKENTISEKGWCVSSSYKGTVEIHCIYPFDKNIWWNNLLDSRLKYFTPL